MDDIRYKITGVHKINEHEQIDRNALLGCVVEFMECPEVDKRCCFAVLEDNRCIFTNKVKDIYLKSGKWYICTLDTIFTFEKVEE